MQIIKIKYLTNIQFQQINQLWDEEYPLQLQGRFQKLLEESQNFNHYLMEDEKQNIVAWAIDFEKDNEIRFSILVHPRQQRQGLGNALIHRLKADLQEFYGWVIDHNDYKKANGTPYLSPLSFYIKQDFEILHDTRMDTDLLKAVKIKWANPKSFS